MVAPITDLGVRIRFALHVSFTSRASRNPSRARGASSPRRVCVRAALSVGAGAGGGRGASVTAGVGVRAAYIDRHVCEETAYICIRVFSLRLRVYNKDIRYLR